MTTIDLFTLIEKSVTSLAIIIGGIWAYFKFVKGRLFYSRLQTSIEGKVKFIKNVPHLFINYEVKNIGLSKVDLDKDKCVVIIFKYIPPEDSLKIESAYWEEIGVFAILEKHDWVESNEIIRESNLYSISENKDIIYKAVIRVVGKGKAWEALCIIFNK